MNDLTSINEKLMAHTFNSLRECISITDMNDNIIYVNDAFLKTYGYTREEIYGLNISEMRSSKNDPEKLKSIRERTLAGGWEGEIYNTRKDGSEFLISLRTSVVKNEFEEPIAMVGTAIELTDRMEYEEKLKNVESKFYKLFYEIKDTVYESTPDGRLVDINPSGVELFEYDSKEELLAADISNDLYVDPSEREKFKQLLENKGYVKNYEIVVKTKNGNLKNVIETAFPVKDSDGNILAYRGILRDVTESKKAEEELKKYVKKLDQANQKLTQSEQELKKMNDSKDKLFSIIAHDLRSPFTSLIGLSDFIVEDIEELSREEIKSFASMIRNSAQNVFNLLENLLQWSRFQTGRMDYDPTILSLRMVSEQSINILEGKILKKKITIENNADNDIYVYADHNMINSVVQNLISNALKFTNKGGKIEISTGIEGDMAYLKVSDNGIGISPDVVDKLFRIDAHHTSLGTEKEVGSGLGLVLCKDLVNKNGGEIEVESEKGKGSTFKITLPLTEKYES